MGGEAPAEVEASLSFVDFIRKNPYQEDPTEYMIRELDEIARESRQPLSEEDKSALRRDWGRKSDELPPDVRARYRSLIKRRLEIDRDKAIEHPGHSFSNALEWATDMAMPLVCEIAIEVVEQDLPAQPRTFKKTAKDLVGLMGCGLLTALLLGGAVALLGAIFHC